MADLVLWTPQAFGAKPKLVIKGGLINWALMGDPNASLPTTQPIIYRPMFGAFGSALTRTSVTFVSQAGVRRGHRRAIRAPEGARAGVRAPGPSASADMVRNDATPRIEVDPETFAVTVDGVHATVDPVDDGQPQPALLLQLSDGRSRTVDPVDRVRQRRRPGVGRAARAARPSTPCALDQWEAQRSRLRKTTEGGVELAISLDRSVQLRDGDILDWDEARRTGHRGAHRPQAGDDRRTSTACWGCDPEVIARTCVELGHAIGNQHWPAVVKGDPGVRAPDRRPGRDVARS